MARAGGGRVVSSGRVSVPVRPLSNKKRTSTRKISTTSADSGYSLCSTDSEDQVLVINKGLDRCAALLQDILHSDVRENTTKPHKVTLPRTHFKPSVIVKKTAVKKPSTAPHVHKEKGVVRKSAPSGGFNHVEVQRPPVTALSPALPTPNCDHVQTQMQLLNRVPCSAPSMPGPESAVLFNCRLPSSTPTLSPQHPANHQDTGYEMHQQSLPLGGAVHFPSAEIATSMAQSLPPAACTIPAQHTSTVPLSYSLTRQADILSQSSNYKNQILDSDLLQYVAAHLAHLRSQENACTPEPVPEKLNTETEETSSDEEEDMRCKATARDISCQTSFNSHRKCSPEKTERKIRTVNYLLGEIKALVADQDDGEALRLVTELEHSMSLLPAVVESTNVHAEIALALQPLRSENAQLRRRLRIVNQQLRDRERSARSDEHSNEVTLLQSMNETLQQQLMESQKSLEYQQKKTEELMKVVETRQEENKTLSQIIQEKEQEIHQIQQQNEMTTSRLKQMEIDDAVGNVKSLQFKLESAEKEKQILGITLRQRDAEVSRLRELTRTLQASMAKLLCDLGKDQTRARVGGQLTQAALDSHEKRLSTDQCPASTSIISYLKRLEMDQVIPSPSDQADQALTSDPSNDLLISKGHINYQRPEPTIAPCSPQKLRMELNSESSSLIGDEYKPDETTYLPLASSPNKASFEPPARLMCTPPKTYIAERDSGDKISASERNRAFPKSFFNAAEAPEKPTGIKVSDLPKPKEPPRPLRNPRVSDIRLNDQSAFDVMSATSDWSIASFSTFTSHDEQDFRNGLAALDANIAKLQRTLQCGVKK